MQTRTKWFRYHLTTQDWIDVRITENVRGKEIIKFAVNLSVEVSGKVYSAIRYDNAHGYSHIDRFWEDGKENIEGKNKSSVMKMARKDILSNWLEYRSRVVKKLLEGYDGEEEQEK